MRKQWLTGALCLILALALTLSSCGRQEPEESQASTVHEHVWTEDGKASVPAICGASGIAVYVCSVEGCGETKTERTAATGEHSFGENNICDVCGYIDMTGCASPEEAVAAYGFFHADEDGSKTYTVGDTVCFGSYPQRLVEDGTLLTALADFEPAEQPDGDWTSYGYYDQGVQADYMFFRDVELDGARYRGVYLQAYRPYYFDLSADGEHSYIDDQGYALNQTYWFAYAPIAWNVLDYQDGQILLSAQVCLEGQPFQAVYTGGSADTIAAPEGGNLNDWESSTLRAFLNGAFSDLAFTAEEKALIATVTLDNRTSGFSTNAYQTCQNDTDDRVFLLSYKDIGNEDYGFLATAKARARSFTDYAVIQGLRPSGEGTTEDGQPSCFYMLRSAGSSSYTITGVSKQGTPTYEPAPFKLDDGESHDGYAANGDFGVLPALCLKVGPVEWEEHTLTYTHRSGEEATLEYALCFPSSYSNDGEPLPLITYIPDATYRSQGIGKVEQAALPQRWVTEELLEKYPAVYLALTLTKYSYTDSAEGDYLDGLTDPGSEEYQVAALIDQLCQEYNIDENRLYLTGQSMGGIFDWALNHTYPDKFAATVYVACQPGGEVSTEEAPVEMYDKILEQASFAGQNFVYIASRLDPKSSVGQDDAEAVLQALGQTEGTDYGKAYNLDPADPAGSSETLRALFAEGYPRYFLAFPQVADGSMQEHMASFDLAYQIEAVLEWLLQQ